MNLYEDALRTRTDKQKLADKMDTQKDTSALSDTSALPSKQSAQRNTSASAAGASAGSSKLSTSNPFDALEKDKSIEEETNWDKEITFHPDTNANEKDTNIKKQTGKIETYRQDRFEQGPQLPAMEEQSGAIEYPRGAIKQSELVSDEPAVLLGSQDDKIGHQQPTLSKSSSLQDTNELDTTGAVSDKQPAHAGPGDALDHPASKGKRSKGGKLLPPTGLRDQQTNDMDTTGAVCDKEPAHAKPGDAADHPRMKGQHLKSSKKESESSEQHSWSTESFQSELGPSKLFGKNVDEMKDQVNKYAALAKEKVMHYGGIVATKLRLPALAEKLQLNHVYTSRLQPTFQRGWNGLSAGKEKLTTFTSSTWNKIPFDTISNKLHLQQVSKRLHLNQLASSVSSAGSKMKLGDLKTSTMDAFHTYFSMYVASLSRFLTACTQQSPARRAQMGFILFFNGFLPLFFLDTAEAHMVLLSFALSTILMHLLYELTGGLSPLTDAAHFVWLPVLLNIWATAGLESKETSGVKHFADQLLLRPYFYALWIRALLVVDSICLTFDMQRLSAWWNLRGSSADKPLLVIPSSVLEEAKAYGTTLQVEIKHRKLSDTELESLNQRSLESHQTSTPARQSMEHKHKLESDVDVGSHKKQKSSSQQSLSSKQEVKPDSTLALPPGEGSGKQVEHRKAPPIKLDQSTGNKAFVNDDRVGQAASLKSYSNLHSEQQQQPKLGGESTNELDTTGAVVEKQPARAAPGEAADHPAGGKALSSSSKLSGGEFDSGLTSSFDKQIANEELTMPLLEHAQPQSDVPIPMGHQAQIEDNELDVTGAVDDKQHSRAPSGAAADHPRITHPSARLGHHQQIFLNDATTKHRLDDTKQQELEDHPLPPHAHSGDYKSIDEGDWKQ